MLAEYSKSACLLAHNTDKGKVAYFEMEEVIEDADRGRGSPCQQRGGTYSGR